MNTWLNKYCPSFMIVPRKQHPYGNKYHSIADGDKGYPIMWQVKLQEGMDRPKKEDGSPAYPPLQARLQIPVAVAVAHGSEFGRNPE
jgi:hypothetical protein